MENGEIGQPVCAGKCLWLDVIDTGSVAQVTWYVRAVAADGTPGAWSSPITFSPGTPRPVVTSGHVPSRPLPVFSWDMGQLHRGGYVLLAQSILLGHHPEVLPINACEACCFT